MCLHLNSRNKLLSVFVVVVVVVGCVHQHKQDWSSHLLNGPIPTEFLPQTYKYCSYWKCLSAWTKAILLISSIIAHLGFPGGLAGQESACNVGDLSLIPGLGRFPGERKGYPLQYSGLKNSMDCSVHGVAKSWTRLNDSHHNTHFSDYCTDVLEASS